jgi:antitoxin MazE
MTTELGRWGNSLGVRIPKALAERAGLQEGDRVSLDVANDGALVIRAATPRYSLDELVAGITPRNRHDETDWGAPVGKEPW